MKIELVLRRSEFKDYYDLYCILREGRSLKELIAAASRYSNHRLKTRDAISFLFNGDNYRKGRDFQLLEHVYDIDHMGIEEYIRSVIKSEFDRFLQYGSGNVLIGSMAGWHETGSNRPIIDKQPLTGESDTREKALIVGEFDADPANQAVVLNKFLVPSKFSDVLVFTI